MGQNENWQTSPKYWVPLTQGPGTEGNPLEKGVNQGLGLSLKNFPLFWTPKKKGGGPKGIKADYPKFLKLSHFWGQRVKQGVGDWLAHLALCWGGKKSPWVELFKFGFPKV